MLPYYSVKIMLSQILNWHSSHQKKNIYFVKSITYRASFMMRLLSRYFCQKNASVNFLYFHCTCFQQNSVKSSLLLKSPWWINFTVFFLFFLCGLAEFFVFPTFYCSFWIFYSDFIYFVSGSWFRNWWCQSQEDVWTMMRRLTRGTNLCWSNVVSFCTISFWLHLKCKLLSFCLGEDPATLRGENWEKCSS